MECGGEKRRKSDLHTQRCLDHETHLSDLPFDVLKQIVFSAVKTSDDGPRDFARIRSFSKDFLRAAEDEDVLKAIKFDGRIKASWRHGFSGHINGLAYRCAGAGNGSAHCLLAEEVVWAVLTILANNRAHDPEGLASAAFFLSHFDFIRSPEYKSYDCVPRRSIHHVEVVRTFFLECSLHDALRWQGILMCMALYFKYFELPQRFRLRYHEVMSPFCKWHNAVKLFQSFKESTMKFPHPSLEKELAGLDDRVRAAMEELKAGVEIDKMLSYEELSRGSFETAMNGLWYSRLEADRKVLESLRLYRETEKKVIMWFQHCKANVITAIDGYILGSPRPPKCHINDASAIEGYYNRLRSLCFRYHAIR